MNATIYHNMMNAGDSESIPALHRNILEFHHGVTLSRSQISLAGGEVSLSDYKYQWKWDLQAWKFGGKDRFVTASFPSLIKDGNDNSFPQIHLLNTNTTFFFEDLTGKHFYNLAYKLHFLHTDLPTLHRRACFHNTFSIIDLSEMLPYAVCYKKINNATVEFVVFCQQPSSLDLCVNIAHIRSKTFRCVRKYIKFVKSFFSSSY